MTEVVIVILFPSDCKELGIEYNQGTRIMFASKRGGGEEIPACVWDKKECQFQTSF